jgi:ATP-dependent Clp protease ATP-binding subunit ClpA
LLTTALRLRPGQVVVFEDVDKAHPEVAAYEEDLGNE